MANTLNSTNNIEVMNSIVDKTISEYEDDTLKKVGKNAFLGCEALSSVTLPSVKSLGEKAFKDCESLEDITVGMNYDGVVSIEDDTFDGCNPVNVIVPKDKVDLYKNSDSWSGFVGTDGVLTVNWGKCGGDDDVVVTYKEGEGLWIPKTFFTQAPMRTATSGVNSTIPDIGYIGKFAYNYPNDGHIYCGIVYRLPQELGKWLYDNAESGNAYGNSISSSKYYGLLWNGIAIYPDSPTEWTSSDGWGIAIRKGSEIGIMKKESDGTIPTDYNYDITSEPFYSYINADDYYMVAEDNAESVNKYALSGMMGLFGDNTIYFRHWKTMSSAPSANNKGKEYTVPSELIDGFVKNTSKSGTQGSIYGLKDSFTVNWGRCGGNSDVIVTYKKGEGLWVPKAFITQAYTSTSSGCTPNADNLDTSVGYKTWVSKNDASTSTRNERASMHDYFYVIYKLPQGLGEYLHKNAENYTNGCYIGDSIGSGGNKRRAYNGIALYSDTVTNWTDDGYGGPKHWGVGIRTKSTLKYIGLSSDLKTPTTDGGVGENYWGAIDGIPQIKALEDDAYYMIIQCMNRSSSNSLVKYGVNSWIELFGDGNIYFRHFNTMTTAPSATNKGEKYTLDPLLKPLTLPLTVNWGKCGGEEDVIVNYDKEEGLWIPKEFLTQGWDSSNNDYPVADAYIEGTTTYDDSVGYKTWFGYNDSGTRSTRAPMASGNDLYIAVYKLPQALGEYLYTKAESGVLSGWSSWGEKIYKGIAIYPDTMSTWDGSIGWGIGIRKKEDIPYLYADNNGVGYAGDNDKYGCIKNYQQWKSLDDNAYYLVAQHSIATYSPSSRQFINRLISITGDRKIYLRHFLGLGAPTSDTTTHGKKYDVPLSLPPDDAKPLGGKIFYIDPTDNGATYTFYDSSGNKVKGTTVSELASAVYYVKKGTSTVDRIWVYRDEGKLPWGFNGVVTNVRTSNGKENTNALMAMEYEDGTIWSRLAEVRKETGCDDWYVPSYNDLSNKALYNSGYRSSTNYIWTSREDTYSDMAWHWSLGSNTDYTAKRTTSEVAVFFRTL